MNKTTRKPELLKQNDIISFYHIQMPHWLFADRRYNTISLAAKVAYSLLLNRYQLSKLHGWISSHGEVYIIYPREELAATLRVGAHKAIGIFRELVDIGLVWEVRRGNNKANHIYLARVELSDGDAARYNDAPFLPGPVGDDGSIREDESADGGIPARGDEPGSAETACPDTVAIYEGIGDIEDTPSPAPSGHAETALPDIPCFCQ
jgi:hypothetical protein